MLLFALEPVRRCVKLYLSVSARANSDTERKHGAVRDRKCFELFRVTHWLSLGVRAPSLLAGKRDAITGVTVWQGIMTMAIIRDVSGDWVRVSSLDGPCVLRCTSDPALRARLCAPACGLATVLRRRVC
eukprot:3656154-Rhodomonas_salina.8